MNSSGATLIQSEPKSCLALFASHCWHDQSADENKSACVEVWEEKQQAEEKRKNKVEGGKGKERRSKRGKRRRGGGLP